MSVAYFCGADGAALRCCSPSSRPMGLKPLLLVVLLRASL